MRYKTVFSGIPFIKRNPIRDFSDTTYNDFIDTINRVEYKTAAQAAASHHCIFFYVNKENLNIIRAMVTALHPEFMKKVSKTTNGGVGTNKHVSFHMLGNNQSGGMLVSEGKSWAQRFQQYKANGRIVKYDKANPLKGYTQNGTVVMLTAANENLDWLDQQRLTTTPSATTDQSGKPYTTTNPPPKTTAKAAGNIAGMSTNTILMCGAGFLLLFLLFRKRKERSG